MPPSERISNMEALDKEVMRVLEIAGLQHLRDTLSYEKVTISDLLQMGEEDLKEFGVGKLFHRRKIIAAVSEYRQEKGKQTGK